MKIWINVHFETDRSFCASVTSPQKTSNTYIRQTYRQTDTSNDSMSISPITDSYLITPLVLFISPFSRWLCWPPEWVGDGPPCWTPTCPEEWGSPRRTWGRGIWGSRPGRSSAERRPGRGWTGTRPGCQCTLRLSDSASRGPEG